MNIVAVVILATIVVGFAVLVATVGRRGSEESADMFRNLAEGGGG